jgi:hypothetical protein
LRVDNKIEIRTVYFYNIISISNGDLHVRNCLKGRYPTVMKVWQQWWKDEHDAFGIACVPLVIEYHENYGKMPGNDIQQNETPLASCGESGAMHAYYKIVEGKDAHAEDFSYDYIDEIRLFLADRIREHGISKNILDKRVPVNDFDAFITERDRHDTVKKAKAQDIFRRQVQDISGDDELTKEEIRDIHALQDIH